MAVSLLRGERDAGLRWDGRGKEVGMDTPDTAGTYWDSCLQARCPKSQFNKAMDCGTVHNRDWVHSTLLQTWLYLTLSINHMISRHLQFSWYLLFYFQVWCFLSLLIFLLCLPCTGTFLRHQLIVNRKRSCRWDFSFVTRVSLSLLSCCLWQDTGTFCQLLLGFLTNWVRSEKSSAVLQLVWVCTYLFIQISLMHLCCVTGGSWGASAQDNQHLSPVQYIH